VYIFETENHTALRGDMSARVEITRRLFEDYEDITSDECIEDYYNTLFKFKDDSIQSNSMYRYVCSRHDDICNVNNIEFRSYAENFNLIKDDSIALIIDNNQRTHELIEALSSRKFSVKRKLQRYAVSLRIGDFKKAFDEGLIKEIEGVFVLSDSVYYREDVGLDLDFNYDSIVG
jgi:CRISPR-associated endonuclease/helicase Cas3